MFAIQTNGRIEYIRSKPHITRSADDWKLQFGKKQFHAKRFGRIIQLLRREYRERITGMVKL